MLRAFAIIAILLPGPALAQQADSAPPQRIRSVTVTGDQACPPSTSEEVVVCARINPDELFRIPKQFRNDVEPSAANQSWATRVTTVDRVSRIAGGLPDTCSPVGTGGQTGCAIATVRAYAAEKRAAERETAAIPGDQ